MKLALWCAVSLLALFFGIATFLGAPAGECIRYISYCVCFIWVPGIIVYRALSDTEPTALSLLLYGWVVGQLLEISAGLLLIQSGASALLVWWPIPFYVLGCWQWRQGGFSQVELQASIARLLLPLLLVCTVLVLSAGFFRDKVLDGCFIWMSAFTNTVGPEGLGRPFQDPFLFGMPLHYHYFINLHIASASHVMDISVLNIAWRLMSTLALLFILALLWQFSEVHFKSRWIGLLAGLQIFGTYGYTTLWEYCHMATSSIGPRLCSTLVAFEVLILLSHELILFCRDTTFSRKRFALISLVFLASSGVRAHLLPVVGAATALLIVIAWFVSRPLCKRLTAVLVSCSAAFLLAAYFVYGLGAESDSSKMFRLEPLNRTAALIGSHSSNRYGPVYQYLHERNVGEALSTAGYLAVALPGRLSFLLPGVIVYLVFLWFRAEHRWLSILLIGYYVAGLGAVLLLYNVFQEQWAFFWYGDFAAALLGASGLIWLLSSAQTLRLKAAVLTPTIILACLQVYFFVVPLTQEMRQYGFPPRSGMMPADQQLADWMREHLPRASVLAVHGEDRACDVRIFPAVVPAMQLYASPGVLDIYLARGESNPSLRRRRDLIRGPLSLEAVAEIRAEIGARPLFILCLDQQTDRTVDAFLERLYQVGTMTLYRPR